MGLWGWVAWRYLRRRGADIVFGGRLLEKLDGRPDYDRDTLVIVRYRSAEHFLDLSTRPGYRFLSFLRDLATANLVYGFSRRLDVDRGLPKDTLKYWGTNLYLVHQFQIDRRRLEEAQGILPEMAYRHKARLFFSGVAEASIVKGKTGRGEATPFFMDGLIIFEADSKEALMRIRHDDRYRRFESSTSRSSFYLFSREW